MMSLYNAVLLPLRPLAAAWALWRGSDPARRLEWQERTGGLRPAPQPGGIWIHGASAGEARIVQALARELRRLRPECPLSASAYSAAGREGLPDVPDVDAAFFLPLDFRGYVRHTLNAVRPGLLALVETELWPNLLNESQRSGAPVVVVNGRLSAERMTRYRRIAPLLRPLLQRVARVGAQSVRDAERFASLGVPEPAIQILGNIKYDLPRPAVDLDVLRASLELPAERRVFVAGSTGQGEEPLVLDAFEALRREHPQLFLILAPRHPPRAAEVERLIGERGLACSRLSAGGTAAAGDVLLVDSVGKLAQLYGVASVAFVGGSLVPVGGHNVLEPAALGVPVLFGPHTGHVAEPAEALVEGGGALRVSDPSELARRVSELLADERRRLEMGGRADALVERSRGALGKSVRMILDQLDAREPRHGERP